MFGSWIDHITSRLTVTLMSGFSLCSFNSKEFKNEVF